MGSKGLARGLHAHDQKPHQPSSEFTPAQRMLLNNPFFLNLQGLHRQVQQKMAGPALTQTFDFLQSRRMSDTVLRDLEPMGIRGDQGRSARLFFQLEQKKTNLGAAFLPPRASRP